MDAMGNKYNLEFFGATKLDFQHPVIGIEKKNDQCSRQVGVKLTHLGFVVFFCGFMCFFFVLVDSIKMA